MRDAFTNAGTWFRSSPVSHQSPFPSPPPPSLQHLPSPSTTHPPSSIPTCPPPHPVHAPTPQPALLAMHLSTSASPLPAPPQPPHPRLAAVGCCQEPSGGDEGRPTQQPCLLEQSHLPGLGVRRAWVTLDDPGLSRYMSWRMGQKRGSGMGRGRWGIPRNVGGRRERAAVWVTA